MTIKVEKTDKPWTGIPQKLDTIVFMGWPSSPANITVKPSVGDEMFLGLDKYFYVEGTKKLTVLHDFDMNLDYTINFL